MSGCSVTDGDASCSASCRPVARQRIKAHTRTVGAPYGTGFALRGSGRQAHCINRMGTHRQAPPEHHGHRADGHVARLGKGGCRSCLLMSSTADPWCQYWDKGSASCDNQMGRFERLLPCPSG
jgi:hypothetical protein